MPVWVKSAELPSEVLKAHSIFGVCVGAAHFHFELLVEKQHKVYVSIVSVHVHQEGVFHHQPAPWPAEAETMMTNTVQALDPVAPWSLENGPLPETQRWEKCATAWTTDT